MKKTIAILITTLSVAHQASANETRAWYIKPFLGVSETQDASGTSQNIGSQDGQIKADVSTGFTSGIGIGYRYNARWSSEFVWEYRSNESETVLPDGELFSEGNYASNMFALNGRYHFAPIGRFEPFVGLGVTYAQEIDIDLESEGVERSYSGDGDVGFQAFGGFNMPIGQQWTISTELRFSSTSDIELSGEGIAGTIRGFDYQPITFQIGAAYSF